MAVVTTPKRPEFCMPVVVRGVQWEHAPADTIDVQPCPDNHTGKSMDVFILYPLNLIEKALVHFSI